jgi:hypothetical protein
MSNAFLALLYAACMLLAALDREGRAAHDLLLGTRVVYRVGSHALELLPAAKPRR